MQPSRIGRLALAALVLAAAAFALGRATGDDVTWHSGLGILGGGDRSPKFSASLDDGATWTFGATSSVARWIDAKGDAHSGGWPDCLTPPSEQRPDRPQVVTIRFGTVQVDHAEFGAGPMVVAVDCRG